MKINYNVKNYKEARKVYFELFVDMEHKIRALSRCLKCPYKSSLVNQVSLLSFKNIPDECLYKLFKIKDSKFLKFPIFYRFIKTRNNLAHKQGNKLLFKKDLIMMKEIYDFLIVLEKAIHIIESY